MASQSPLIPKTRLAGADPRKVQQLARDWSNEYIECRTYGHHWQPSRATWNTRYSFYHVVQLCPRCTSERHMECGASGAVFSTWINYADGYLTEGVGRITGESRDVLRLAAITRTFPLDKISGAAARDASPHSQATRLNVGLSVAS